MKKILGLDLGTNSIGWALVEQDIASNHGKILRMGSRIIPMSQDILGDFGKGNSVSQTAERTRYRSMRRLRERYLLRRERLHRVLNVLGFLPDHYAKDIDFEKSFGKFKEETETKLPWKKGEDGKMSFLFNASFNEMVAEFKASGQDIKIPYDWTIYFLRKKALSSKITKEELAWLILNFNQKRGYYQLRGEEEESNNDIKEFVIPLRAIKIEKGEVDKKNEKKSWYTITFSNNWTYSATFSAEPNWIDTERDFLVTEEYDEYGNIKIVKDKRTDLTGREKRKITPLPTFDEINIMSKEQQDKIFKKIKTRTEVTISNSGKTVGAFIYETLLQKPTQKIRGKLVRTIERKFYKDELRAILEKQIELQPELFTDEMYIACVRELYKSNEAHQFQLSKRNFVHLFLEDIIFYQRPLRSQKSSISNCTLEFRKYKQTGESGKEVEVKEYLKTIPKSNPYYQEFRVWQWMYNLKIYSKSDDNEVTSVFLKSVEDWESLFEFLMSRKEVNHTDILNHLITPILKEKYPDAKPKALKNEISKEIAKYRWNYVFDDSKEKEEEKSKKYPMNETGFEVRRLLEKVDNIPTSFLNRNNEQELWHIIYSVKDPIEYEKALKTFAKRNSLDVNSFAEEFKKFKPFKSEYGTYSEKAIKKLLPLMRIGKYWNENEIPEAIKNRAKAISERLKTIKDEKEIETIADDDIPKQILKSFYGLDDLTKGLKLYQASYLVYGRHSEGSNNERWETSQDLQEYLYRFKQHELRNPIVEQVITETLRTVKDIWEHYAEKNNIPFEMVYDEHRKKNVRSYPRLFEEIHIELGRDMKNTADERKRMTSQISDKENTNQRIKLMLMELNSDADIENVRPFSPIQQDILKIYEDGVLSRYSEQELKNVVFDEVETGEAKNVYEISRKAQPTKNELIRYKLWLEQKYCSPYTGQPIPFSKLFTPAYEIEHIIPQSRYYDDSLSNKVICESAVNSLKGNKLGLEFIKNPEFQTVEIGGGKSVRIFTEDEYRKFVDENYSKNKAKRNKLLLEEIPEQMIARQMNDTRYISKFVMQLLSNIVRDDKSRSNDDGVNSKNVIPCSGKITDRLKQDWGLNDVWNELILPRFERMNELTSRTDFTATNREGHTIPAIPFEYSKGFSKKRIDHRHHAMDALVIACATRDHVNLLNNEHAKSDKLRLDLRSKLCYKKFNDNSKQDYKWIFKKPWGINDNQSLMKSTIEFPVDAKNELEKIVVSFKQNLRVINKATNYYEKFENGKKIEVKQEGTNWAIRKSLHEETISGLVVLPWVKLGKGEFTTANRKSLDVTFNEEKIKKVSDTGIQKILLSYLISKGNNTELAFSPEGIEELNKHISLYNNGKFHQPIFKVRIYEKGSGRFNLGEKGSKKTKYVQGAPNLFFALYTNEQQQSKGGDRKPTNRSCETIPLNIVIERQKQGLTPVPQTNEIGERLLFYFSPNDLVYIPTEDELASINAIDFNNLTKVQIKRIFFVNDFSGTTCYFRPNRIASNIAPKEVDLSYDERKNKLSGSFDNKTASFEGRQIKDFCIKLVIDRLGNISKA